MRRLRPEESASVVLERGRAALAFLLEAQQFARQLGRSVWDFAVEIEELQARGLSTNDLRWLVCMGFVEHRREVSPIGDQVRSFEVQSALSFGAGTCFILTEAGAAFVRKADVPPPTQGPDGGLSAELPTIRQNGCVPVWDRDRQELRVGRIVVKQFKVPAVNQERILAAFEEEGWPVHIDDPLPPSPDQDPKRRLHDTINSLNRKQKCPVIRFVGDGSGQGVRWEFVEEPPGAGAGAIP